MLPGQVIDFQGLWLTCAACRMDQRQGCYDGDARAGQPETTLLNYMTLQESLSALFPACTSGLQEAVAKTIFLNFLKTTGGEGPGLFHNLSSKSAKAPNHWRNRRPVRSTGSSKALSIFCALVSNPSVESVHKHGGSFKNSAPLRLALPYYPDW